MPNQRKKGRVQIGGYFDQNLKLWLKAIAHDKTLSLSKLVEEILTEAVNSYLSQKGQKASLGKSSSSTSISSSTKKNDPGENPGSGRKAA